LINLEQAVDRAVAFLHRAGLYGVALESVSQFPDKWRISFRDRYYPSLIEIEMDTGTGQIISFKKEEVK